MPDSLRVSFVGSQLRQCLPWLGVTTSPTQWALG